MLRFCRDAPDRMLASQILFQQARIPFGSAGGGKTRNFATRSLREAVYPLSSFVGIMGYDE